MSPFDAAPLTCAGVTTYSAIKAAAVVPGERIGVFGIGGLGHLAVQYARLVGGVVVGVDVEEPKLALATELGADATVDARAGDPVAAMRDLGGLRPFSPSSRTARSASSRRRINCGRVRGPVRAAIPARQPFSTGTGSDGAGRRGCRA
ncbi:zinc-binding dehydrogenase [Pseudonocardia sp. CA-107938]|uniref:zinc-binding dehydrogenase n=1 Tax=Pseudonocardia sp. CA-107938 TaxID=3240021 RepID=UPI003D918E38